LEEPKDDKRDLKAEQDKIIKENLEYLQEKEEEVSKDFSEADKSKIKSVDNDEKYFITKKELEAIIQNLALSLQTRFQEIETKTTEMMNTQAMNFQTALNDTAKNFQNNNGAVAKEGSTNKNQEMFSQVLEILKNNIGKFSGDNSNEEAEFLKTLHDKTKQEALNSMDIVSLINRKVKSNLVREVANSITDNVGHDVTIPDPHGA